MNEELDLNTYLVRNKPATFMFFVKGDSMVGATLTMRVVAAITP